MSAHHTPDSIYHSHQKAISAYFARKNQSEEEVKDLSQQTFLQMVKSWDQRQSEEATTVWLHQIARSVLSNKIRHDKTQKRHALSVDIDTIELFGEIVDPDLKIHQQRRIQALEKCILQLPPQMERVVQFRYIHEKSVSQTAQLMDIRNGTVKSTLHSATKKLEECLQRLLGRPA